jgi:sortase (surface protein transpeptidase)
MTWILLILSVSSVLIGNPFFIFAKKKKKKKKEKKKKRKRKKRKKKRKRKEKEKRAKRFEIKAPCNNSDLVIPFKHDQVLLNFQC